MKFWKNVLADWMKNAIIELMKIYPPTVDNVTLWVKGIIIDFMHWIILIVNYCNNIV